jgi:hypothetical protein
MFLRLIFHKTIRHWLYISNTLNPRTYSDDFHSRWQEHMDIGSLSKAALSLKRGCTQYSPFLTLLVPSGSGKIVEQSSVVFSLDNGIGFLLPGASSDFTTS